MPKRSNSFQRLVRRIYSALADTGTTVEESALVQEKNATSMREIDVLLTSEIAGHMVKVAIECRNHSDTQDITWIDSLIGKYANLDIQKVIAVSHTTFTQTAEAKAKQHSIELMTLVEAETLDWKSAINIAALKFFGFRNRPLVVALFQGKEEQTKISYTFEGDVMPDREAPLGLAQFFLAVWDARIAQVAASKIVDHVFDNWERLSRQDIKPRYCEIVQQFAEVRTIKLPTHLLKFDTIVWGVGTKYSLNQIQPETWKFGSRFAATAATFNDQGEPVQLTLVIDEAGDLVGVDLDSG